MGKRSYARRKRLSLGLSMVLLFMVYPRVVRSTFSVFHKHSEGTLSEGGELEYFLTDDFAVVYGKGEHAVGLLVRFSGHGH